MKRGGCSDVPAPVTRKADSGQQVPVRTGKRVTGALP